MEWLNDPQAEIILTHRNITFSIEKVPIGKIDFDASKANRGRIENKLDDARVHEYGCLMLEGTAFPRLVLNKQPDGSYLVMSGNHRARGARDADLKEVEAYVIEIQDSLLLDLLPMLFNIVHGQNVSNEAKYMQAKYLIDAFKLDRRQVSKELNLNYEAFCTYLRCVACLDRLQGLGLDGTKLGRVVLTKLNAITNDVVFKNTAKFLIKNKILVDRAETLIQEVKAENTEKTAQEVLDRWEETISREKRIERPGNVKRTVRTGLISKLRSLENFLFKYKDKNALQVTDVVDEEMVNERLRSIFTRARELGIVSFTNDSTSSSAEGHQRPGVRPADGNGEKPGRGRKAPPVQ